MSQALQREVTIIIAAVVSTMAGGLFSTQSPAPTLSAATEYSLSNGLSIDVLSVSEAIDTKDLEIQVDALADGQRFSTTISKADPGDITGTGAGVNFTHWRNDLPPFGNFTLRSGVKMSGDVTLRSSEGEVHDISGSSAIPTEAIAEAYAPADGVKDPSGEYTTPPTKWTVNGGELGDDEGVLSGLPKMHRLDPSNGHYYYIIQFNDGWTYDFKRLPGNTFENTVTYYPEGDLKAGDKVSVKVIYKTNGQTIYSSDIRVVS